MHINLFIDDMPISVPKDATPSIVAINTSSLNIMTFKLSIDKQKEKKREWERKKA